MKQLMVITFIALLIAAIVGVPTLAQDDPVTAQNVGKRDGATDAGRGGQCFWNGFWAGLTLSDYEPPALHEMPSTRLRALEDKPGPYAAAYILGYQIGYRESCTKIADTGGLLGRITILVPLVILYYSLSPSS